MQKNRFAGYFFALTAIFFWSFNIIIASMFATSLMPLEIAFGRWFVATLILIPLAWKDLNKNFQLLLQNWELIVALAVTGIVIDNTLIYTAGHTASAIDIGLLDVTGPIFLVLLSRIFLKTPITRRQLLGLVVAVFGVVVIIVNGDFSSLANFKPVPGDFWMLLNSFAFAVYSLLQYKRPPQVSQTSMLAATALVGVLIIYPLLIWTTPEAQLQRFNMEDLAVVVYLGIFNSVLSYLCWNSALASIGNIKTSIIYYLLPLFSGVEAYFILGEKMHPASLIGGILVIAGIAFVSLNGAKPQRAAKMPQK